MSDDTNHFLLDPVSRSEAAQIWKMYSRQCFPLQHIVEICTAIFLIHFNVILKKFFYKGIATVLYQRQTAGPCRTPFETSFYSDSDPVKTGQWIKFLAGPIANSSQPLSSGCLSNVRQCQKSCWSQNIWCLFLIHRASYLVMQQNRLNLTGFTFGNFMLNITWLLVSILMFTNSWSDYPFKQFSVN